MSGHIRRIVLKTATFVAIVAAGCATTTVKTDKDPSVNLSSYRTFDVRSGQVFRNGVVDKRDTLVRDRVESALANELQQKGLAPSPQDPDLIATYSAGARSGKMERNHYSGLSYGGTHTGTWVDEYTEGTLLIDLIDPETNKLVWRSIVEMDDERDLRSAKNITMAVSKALEKYPGQ